MFLEKFSIIGLVCLALGLPLRGSEWKAGVATEPITPEKDLWMAGYAARTGPSKGAIQNLYVKALALQHSQGGNAVLVTADLLGFSAEFVERVAGRVRSRHGLDRSRMLFNVSHTHSGPAMTGVLDVAHRMSPQQEADVAAYTNHLVDQFVRVVDRAFSEMTPARLSRGNARTGFAVNRRVNTGDGYKIGVNRSGPVDHNVPFLVVDSEEGQLRAVVFGYACHNTTVGGDQYHFHGDYAGFAQAWIEENHPGVVAMFVTGTAGDANPYPRGTVSLARRHGERLAGALDESLTGPLASVPGPLKTAFGHVLLEFERVPTRVEIEAQLESDDPFLKRHAEAMLDRLRETGEIRSSYPFPVQVWRFGDGPTLIGLAGEVVVDYGLRLARELPSEDLWVMGYCNDVFAYLPSRRILAEGGYEAVESMIFYGQPSPFSPTVEEEVIGKVHELLKELAIRP